MNYNLVLTPIAEESIDNVMSYLLAEWGITVHDQFIEELNHCIDIIRQNPFSFSRSSIHFNIRRCVVTPQNILYYRIEESNIVILELEDSRMNPDKLDYLLTL